VLETTTLRSTGCNTMTQAVRFQASLNACSCPPLHPSPRHENGSKVYACTYIHKNNTRAHTCACISVCIHPHPHPIKPNKVFRRHKYTQLYFKNRIPAVPVLTSSPSLLVPGSPSRTRFPSARCQSFCQLVQRAANTSCPLKHQNRFPEASLKAIFLLVLPTVFFKIIFQSVANAS